MKILWYFLTVLLGVYGILAVLHTIELLVTSAGLLPAELIAAIVALLLASVCLKKARNKIPRQE